MLFRCLPGLPSSLHTPVVSLLRVYDTCNTAFVFSLKGRAEHPLCDFTIVPFFSSLRLK